MTNKVALVTGGNGFVGQCLVKQLLQSGAWRQVRVFDISPELRINEEDAAGAATLRAAVKDGRLQYVRGDLRDEEQVQEVFKGIDVVFHMASPSSHSSNRKLFEDVNVKGTRHVIQSCLTNGVAKLVFTSSGSVVFDGSDIKNGDETLPYPPQPLDDYSRTKAEAEQLVLSANGKQGLLTCALRPCGVFGPGDPMMLPAMVKTARAGKMKAVIGRGNNLWDWTFVDNVAHAHICAEKALVPGKVEGEDVAAGKAFIISNGEPYPFWDFTYALLQDLGYDGPKFRLPRLLVLVIATILDAALRLISSLLHREIRSEFTPSRIRLITSWRFFNISRAAQLLGYTPLVSLKEGMRRTVECRPDLRRDAVP